ncbi:unnamed protein product, partial [Ilex paraguariensis]
THHHQPLLCQEVCIVVDVGQCCFYHHQPRSPQAVCLPTPYRQRHIRATRMCSRLLYIRLSPRMPVACRPSHRSPTPSCPWCLQLETKCPAPQCLRLSTWRLAPKSCTMPSACHLLPIARCPKPSPHQPVSRPICLSLLPLLCIAKVTTLLGACLAAHGIYCLATTRALTGGAQCRIATTTPLPRCLLRHLPSRCSCPRPRPLELAPHFSDLSHSFLFTPKVYEESL